MLQIPYTPSTSPRLYGIYKRMEGIPPLEGMEFTLQFRPPRIPFTEFTETRPAWLHRDGKVETRVKKVTVHESLATDPKKPSSVFYRVVVAPVGMSLAQLEVLVQLEWTKECGWDVLVDHGVMEPR